MFPYIFLGIVIIVINVLFYKKTKYSFFAFLLLFVLLLLYSVLREISVGTDFQYYKDMFNTIGEHALNDPKTKEILWKKEYGWYYMNKFLYNYGSFFLYVFTTYLISYFLIFKAVIDKSTFPFFSVFLYFFCGYYFASYNVMRQFFVFSFFIYSIRFIENRNFWKYAIILIIASTYHLSSLFLIPFYFIRKFKWSRVFLITLLVISLLLGYVNFFERIVPYIHFDRLTRYISELHTDISIFGYLIFALNTALGIIILIFTKDINSQGSIYVKLVIFGLIMSNLVLHYKWLFRFSEIYFVPLMIIGYPNIISECKIHNNKVILIYSLLFYSALVFYIVLSHNTNGVIPYRLIF